MNYYLRDCNEEIIGNKNGYKTFKGANTQVNNPKTKINRLLWKTFEDRKDKENMLVCTINQDKP